MAELLPHFLLDKKPYFIYYFTVTNRRVAQLGRALRSGRRGRRFKSCRADEEKRTLKELSTLEECSFFVHRDVNNEC